MWVLHIFWQLWQLNIFPFVQNCRLELKQSVCTGASPRKVTRMILMFSIVVSSTECELGLFEVHFKCNKHLYQYNST